ncbi:hypothetical protein PFISCL1PPCAC_9537, partial [Pristionchus fissidentatus]
DFYLISLKIMRSSDLFEDNEQDRKAIFRQLKICAEGFSQKEMIKLFDTIFRHYIGSKSANVTEENMTALELQTLKESFLPTFRNIMQSMPLSRNPAFTESFVSALAFLRIDFYPSL